MDNASARNMWGDYLDKHLEDAFVDAPRTIKFYDNENDANECANLVIKGTKKAYTPSLLELQLKNEVLPKIGDFFVVLDWSGSAKCIVRVTKVKLKPFFSIDADYAQKVGEGDKSLKYLKSIKWEYYSRELLKYNRKPNESMIVVCQEFEKVFG